MGLKHLIRKLVNEKEPERKLQDPGKNQKEMVRVDPLERIAALKAADWDLTILLGRTSGMSGGGINQWHISEVDPLTFYAMVSDTLGGGAYRMEFRKPDATILRLEGSEKTETHTFTIAGKPKNIVENTKQNAKSADFWQDMMKEGSIGAMIIKSFFENRGQPDGVLMELLKTAISGNGNKALDPTALLSNVTETVVKLKEAAGDSGADPMQYISQFMTMMNQYNMANKPPVSTTGSNSTGIDKFFESLGAAAPAFAPIIAGALASKGEAAAIPAALPPSAPDQMPDSQTQRNTQQSQNPAFAGSGEAATSGAPDPLSKVNPLSAFNAPDLGGAPSLTPQTAAFGAVMKLRYMIGEQGDPIDIAAEMVDTINLLKGARRVEGVWENYIDDPGQAFDEYAPLIPEWLEHPQYRTTCREAMVKAVTDYFESDQQNIAGDGEIETDDATVDQQPPVEPPPDTPTDDTVEQIGNDARNDENGIID